MWKNKNKKGMVRSRFARAFQIRGKIFRPKSAKLSGASQIKLFCRCLIYAWNRVFGNISWWVANWAMKLISILSLCLNIVSKKIALIGNDDFYANLVWVSWCFWVFTNISARSSREKKRKKKEKVFFFDCAVVCQGQGFQFASPNSLKQWR